jgi:hypothetical protein
LSWIEAGSFRDEAQMNKRRSLIVLVVCAWALWEGGCTHTEPQYGTERQIAWLGPRRQVWAVAPVIDLSGQKYVDPLLQADLLYEQLQQVQGITAIPVNRVVEVYASLQIDKVQSEEQAAVVCDLLGCDGLLVASITAYDAYDPPKLGASLQLFARPGSFERPPALDVRELVRSASPGPNESVPQHAGFVQAVGMFDAANGSVRQAVLDYAAGRHDPKGPLGSKEYFVNMDRFSGFAYHSLIRDLMSMVQPEVARNE